MDNGGLNPLFILGEVQQRSPFEFVVSCLTTLWLL